MSVITSLERDMVNDWRWSSPLHCYLHERSIYLPTAQMAYKEIAGDLEITGRKKAEQIHVGMTSTDQEYVIGTGTMECHGDALFTQLQETAECVLYAYTPKPHDGDRMKTRTSLSAEHRTQRREHVNLKYLVL